MINNIIFDLGGVILNINYELTAMAFKQLGITNFDKLYSQAQQNHLFDHLEKGIISNHDFRSELRKVANLEISDEEIDTAWNAMLLDLPKERIDILNAAKKNYRTFLLSNTNDIHYKAYEKDLYQSHGIKSLASLFEKQYLSHQIHFRKPDAEAFEFVLKDAHIKADETLFIDDSIQHINGAKKLGIHTFFMEPKSNLNLNSIFQNGLLRSNYDR